MDGAGASGFGTAEEEPVLFPNCRWADGVLDEVVVDLDVSVIGVDEQLIPEIEGVGDGFSGLAFWQVRGLFGLKLEANAMEDGQALFLTDGAAVKLGIFAQLGFDFVEPLNFEQRLSG